MEGDPGAGGQRTERTTWEDKHAAAEGRFIVDKTGTEDVGRQAVMDLSFTGDFNFKGEI